jgi:hypothetical protein
VPALLITLDRSPAAAARGDFFGEVCRFAAGTGLISGLATLGLMLASAFAWGDGPEVQRTQVLAALVLLGWVTLWRALGGASSPLSPQGRGAGGEGDDRLLRWLPLPGQVVFLAAMYLPPLAGFFELEPLGAARWALVAATAALGSGLMWLSDRRWGEPRRARRG